MRIEALRPFSDQLSADVMDDEKTIDFGSVGLYLGGLQVVFSIVCCGSISVLSCWLLPPEAISAVRTLAITTFVGLLLVRNPLRIGRVRGVTTVFNALRPSVAVYILALVLEQLVHTCVGHDADGEAHGMFRRVVYHIISVFLILSGFIRAKNPRSESDLPFVIAVVCLLATALLPPPAISKSGPLCEPTTLSGAGERVLRALLFSAVYVVLVYAAAPAQNVSNELFVCVARATAASIWVLSASTWALFLAPLQAAIVMFSRLKDVSDDDHHHSQPPTYEHVPLTTYAQPNAPSENGGSDIELGSDISDPEAIKAALAAQRMLHIPANGLSGASGISGGGGLSFNFSGTARSNGLHAIALPQVNMAAVAARESQGA